MAQQARQITPERPDHLPTVRRWSGIRRAAVVLCLIPAAYFVLTAVYGLLNAADYATDLPRQLRYVIGPLIIALALILAAFRLPQNGAIMVGIVTSSILGTLFVFETYLTIRLLPRQGGLVGTVSGEVELEPYHRNLPPAYVIKGLNNALGVKELDQALMSAVPEQMMMLCSRDGQPVTTRTDGYGFRNPPGTAAAADPAEVMVVGDSFAEGICLPDGEGMIGQLRGFVSGPVVNTASRGSGPLFELAVMGRYGPIFRPKVTVMAFFEGNDWENLANEADIGWLAEAMDPNADFGVHRWTPAERKAADSVIAGWWNDGAASVGELFRRRSMLRNYLALANTSHVLGLQYPKATPPNPLYKPLLERARQIADGWGGEFVVAYVPAHNRFAGLLPHQFVYDDLRGMVHEAAKAAGVPVIDLAQAFSGHPDPKLFYAADSHFNSAGASVAAGEIAARLADLGRS